MAGGECGSQQAAQPILASCPRLAGQVSSHRGLRECLKDPKQSCSGRARLLPQCLSLPRGRAARSGNGLDALPAPVPEPAQCGWLRCVGWGVHRLYDTSPAAVRPSWSSRSCTDISHHGHPHSSPVPASLGLAGLQLPLHGPNARVWGASIAARAWQVGIRHTIP